MAIQTERSPRSVLFSVLEGGSFTLFREGDIRPEKSIRKQQCYWSVTAAGSELINFYSGPAGAR